MRVTRVSPMGRVLWRVLIAVVSATVLAGCAGEPAAPDRTEPRWDVDCTGLDGAVAGEDFAETTLPCLTGDGEFALGTVADRPAVVSLWASWCGPCVTEAPEVQRFHELAGSQVTVIGVNTQDARDRALFFAEDFNWTFPSLFDERGEILRSQGLTALPAIMFIDTDGSTVATLTESDVTADDLIDTAREHFGVSI